MWYLLFVFGLTAILIEGKPTKPIRDLASKLGGKWGGYLFRCYQCLGFWVGLGGGFLFFWPDPIKLITAPFIASGVCWLLGTWVKSMEIFPIREVNGNEDEKDDG